MAPRPRRIAAVAEGLAYVGGMLGVVGLVLIAVRSWSDFNLMTRLALSSLTAAVLGFGGLVLSDDRQPQMVRLRQFLWLGSTASFGVVAAVAGDEWFSAGEPPRQVLVIALAVVVASGAYWWWKDGIIQHITGLTATAIAFGAVAYEIWGAGAAGSAVWIVGALFLWVALMYEEAGNWVTGALGGVALIVGALFATQEWIGPALLVAVASAASLLLLGFMFIGPNEAALRVAFTVVGITGLVQGVPPTIAYFANKAGVNTGLVISIVGILLVLAGIRDAATSGGVVTTVGAVATLVGAAVTGVESQDFAVVYGVILAVLLIAGGTSTRHLLMSVVGLVGVSVFVPWGIAHFFPGDDRAPLIVLVVGVMIACSGVVLWRLTRRSATVTAPQHVPQRVPEI